ncbi:pentapeptide repeat-containing protein [Cohnella endophytica]|nr:pentapeptide repeat-containing protein [Cohnella endophytica]
MNQYFMGRHEKELMSIPQDRFHINLVFCNQRPDKALKKSRLTITHSTFANISFLESELTKCDFSHCIFINCYFKKTKLNNIIFVGCKFINCKFDKIELAQSDLRYTSFENCYINYEDIKGCLPSESNIRWSICTNLALEGLRAGNSEQYKRFFFEEKSASEEHYLEMFFQRKKYYKENYDTLDRISGLSKYLYSKLSRLIWGYGERIQNLILVIVATITTFSFLYRAQGSVFHLTSLPLETQSLSYKESFYFSICNFLTISSDFSSSDTNIRTFTLIECSLGLIMLGFFVAGLFRFINRR